MQDDGSILALGWILTGWCMLSCLSSLVRGLATVENLACYLRLKFKDFPTEIRERERERENDQLVKLKLAYSWVRTSTTCMKMSV